MTPFVQESVDLWGEFIPPARKGTRPTGYAGTLGRGPMGETCGTCEHLVRVHGRYFKCGLLRSVWTGGPGTDILKGSKACERWAPLSKQPKP